jgi:hypothetical protein
MEQRSECWCRIVFMNCKTDSHPRRAEIDLAMVNNVPYRTIIETYPEQPLTLGGLNRHWECVKEQLGDAIQQRAGERAERAGDLVSRVELVIADAQAILSDARTNKDLKAAISALGAITRALELLGRASGELSSGAGFHLSVTNNRTTNNVVNVQEDTDLALAVQEATMNFNPDVIHRLKALAEGTITVG